MGLTPEQAADLVDRLERRNPDARDLARLASPAVKVEAELLRRLRLDLLPAADASAEADLWHSPLVEAQNADGLVLWPEVASVLREELRGRRPELLRVREVLGRSHGHLPVLLRLQERVVLLALDDEVADAEVQEALAQVLRAMADPSRASLGRWARRAVPWLPERARSGVGDLLLELAEARGPASETTDGASELDWTTLVEAVEGDPFLVAADLAGDKLTFRPQSADGTSAADRLWLPSTRPLLVELSWRGADGARVHQLVGLDRAQSRTVEVGRDGLRLRTAQGEVFRLRVSESVRIPEERLLSIGRDAQRRACDEAVSRHEKSGWIHPLHVVAHGDDDQMVEAFLDQRDLVKDHFASAPAWFHFSLPRVKTERQLLEELTRMIEDSGIPIRKGGRVDEGPIVLRFKLTSEDWRLEDLDPLRALVHFFRDPRFEKARILVLTSVTYLERRAARAQSKFMAKFGGQRHNVRIRDEVTKLADEGIVVVLPELVGPTVSEVEKWLFANEKLIMPHANPAKVIDAVSKLAGGEPDRPLSMRALVDAIDEALRQGRDQA